MTIEEAINILELHNKWRKGADIEMQPPYRIGMAIDLAVCELKNHMDNPPTLSLISLEKIIIKRIDDAFNNGSQNHEKAELLNAIETIKRLVPPYYFNDQNY
jgi:hypothetical protein